MSKTHCNLKISFTVLDSDHLPDDMDYIEVTLELQGVLDAAVAAWYAERGKDLVSFEPMVF